MNKIRLVMAAGFILMAAMTFAQEPTSQVSRTTDRFVACENVHGGGFYWVDTTSGKLWWANPGKNEWFYVGTPKDAKPGEIGTYVPLANKNGGGLFILKPSTGEGWWAMLGQDWKAFGKPKEEMQPPPTSYTNRTTKAGISINPN
jgi:hypothetical protein